MNSWVVNSKEPIPEDSALIDPSRTRVTFFSHWYLPTLPKTIGKAGKKNESRESKNGSADHLMYLFVSCSSYQESYLLSGETLTANPISCPYNA